MCCLSCLRGLPDYLISFALRSIDIMQRIAASSAFVVMAAGGSLASTGGATAATAQAATASTAEQVSGAASPATIPDVLSSGRAAMPAAVTAVADSAMGRASTAVAVVRGEVDVTASGTTSWATTSVAARTAAIAGMLPPS
jgi:hypothetical protein